MQSVIDRLRNEMQIVKSERNRLREEKQSNTIGLSKY
jgi:hypothetical protein